MEVLFLRNPDTGEVRRLWIARMSTAKLKGFKGWVAVDGLTWAAANANHELVDAAVARYHATDASAPPAADGAGDYQTLSRQVERGTAELRRYVEGNGFKWCEDEDTVFNVTTALGLMGGTMEAQSSELVALQAQLAAAREQLARVEGERDAAVNALNDAESTLYSIGQRLPMTDSYRDVNTNRKELRHLAQEYFEKQHAALQAASKPGEGE